MNSIQICYDLSGNESPEAYEKIIKAILNLGNVQKVQYSTWVIITNYSCEQIRDYLRRFIDSDDSLFISEISAFASYNVPKQVTTLISNNWKPKAPKLVVDIPKLNQPINKLKKRFP